MPLIHFLIMFNHAEQRLVQPPEEFTDGEAAAAAYARLEREHRGDTNLEIVLVGADSIDTIRQTHGNYFDGSVTAGQVAGAAN